MAKQPIYDTERGHKLGEIEIPDDVLAAAEKVYNWLSQQEGARSGLHLHGLAIAD